MKVLVTGAAGYLGSELVPLLVASGHSVRALVRRAQSIPGVETFSGALPNAPLCKELCAGFDAVVHLANIAHVNSDAKSLRVQNLNATVELATAAKAEGISKFIFISSSKARYPRNSAYARYKAEAESALRNLHEPGTFEVVCLRPALIYGRGMKGNLRGLLRMLSRPALPVFVGSDNKLGMISVSDAARAILAALATDALPDQVWELTDGTHYTLNGLVQHVREMQGLPQPVLMLPRTLFWSCAALATVLSPLIKTSLSLSTYKALFTEISVADSQFSLHTGFAPQDSFFSKLPALLEDLKQ